MLNKPETPKSLLSLAAVTAMLLAACGDGSGGSTAVDSQLTPKAPGQSAGSTAPTTPGTGETTDAGADASGNAAGANPTEHITEAGISTALLQKMMSTQTAYVRVGPRAFGIAHAYPAQQTSGEMPQADRQWTPLEDQAPEYYGYQLPVQGKFFSKIWGAEHTPTGKPAPHGQAVTSYVQFGYQFFGASDQPEKRLTLQTHAVLKTHEVRGEQGGVSFRDTSELRAQAVKDIPRNGVVAFKENLQEWQGVNDNSRVALWVSKGDSPDEVALCVEAYSAYDPTVDAAVKLSRGDVQGYSCSVWQVPAGWTEGKALNYQGIYVHEDDTDADHAPNDMQFSYWKTKPWKSEDGLDAGGAAGAGVTAGATAAGAQAGESGAGGGGSAAKPQQPAEEASATTDGVPAEALANSTQDTAAQEAEATAAQAVKPPADAQAPGDTAKPAADAAAPAGDAAKPAADAAAPAGGAAKPAADAAAPAGGAAKPAADAAAPAGDAAKPAADAAAPAGDAAKPDAVAPTGGAAKPAADAAAPAGDAAKPTSDAAAPASDAAKPAADAATPAPDAAKPAPGAAAAPAVDEAKPAANTAAPAIDVTPPANAIPPAAELPAATPVVDAANSVADAANPAATVVASPSAAGADANPSPANAEPTGSEGMDSPGMMRTP